MRRAIKFFQELKDFLGIRFVFDTIAGKRYSVAQVDAAIAKLSNAGPERYHRILLHRAWIPAER